MADNISIELIVKDDGTATIKSFAKGAEKEIDGLGKKISSKLGGAFDKLGKLSGGILQGIIRNIFSLKGAIAGLGLGYLAKETVNIAAGFEKMQLSLDTITKGQGQQWFEDLNAWALKMPVNTEKAIESFIGMRAMGLQPTIADMTTLVDTMSALGGDADMLQGVARALGQIKTKSKVTSEELLQLAERGVPVFDILREKMGLTGEELSNIGNAGLNVDETLAAIMEGLDERFGGQSEKMQGTWAGMVESLISYWKEFARLVMEAGVLDWLKEKLDTVITTIDQMNEDGTLQEWAQIAGETIVYWFNRILDTSVMVTAWIRAHWDQIKNTFETVCTVAQKLYNILEKLFDIAGKTIGTALGGLSIGVEKIASGDVLSGVGEIAKTTVPGQIVTKVIDSFASGTDFVPRTGLYQLHRGESVNTAAETARNRTSGEKRYEINVNYYGGAASNEGINDLARKIKRQMQILEARGVA
jgi:tape measure domain-containing protein